MFAVTVADSSSVDADFEVHRRELAGLGFPDHLDST